eukprot:CAMPEP_0179435374 /NCGR_PEP_ID=MMETSP0799-20121207/19499_1 /TAXON_ID=46947 /ORGANISM="Geminigera cryophila, Strain CCMP2564" /LENGTH=273 /DNA_ID=CAMNT_0021214711 /DNA_START=165 /DNA_END=986 /DNA_ORIENTATION=+
MTASGRAQLPATSRAVRATSVLMVATGKPGAKINVKEGDFDISAPTKRVGEEEDTKEMIPAPRIETECGADYMPLLTALQCEQWEEADQITRDLLIWIGGAGPRSRNFVYFAEVKSLPMKDMKTIDNLWTTYSKGKFGYSVQKQIWNGKKAKGSFELFVTEIDWNKGPCGGCDKICSGCTGLLKRWVPVKAKGNEFVYDLAKAKKGHLPLTSALRGTYLLQSLLNHPAYGASTVVNGAWAGVKAAVVQEKFPMNEAARADASTYYKNKMPWDM